MSRLAPLAPENMPPRQRDAYEDLIAHQRGGVRGPFGVWVRSPGLVTALRAHEVLSGRKRHHRRHPRTHHYHHHAPLGGDLRLRRPRGAGSRQRADARSRGRRDGAGNAHRGHPPRALRSQVLRRIARNQKVSEALYQEAFSLLGEKGVVDLTALVGFYSAISLTLNAFEIPPVT